MGAIYDFKLISGDHEIREYASGTTGNYDAGELVKLTGGALAIATAGTVMGVALKDALTSGVTPVLVITPNQVWSAGYNGTTAETMEGEDYLVTFTHDAQCVSSTTTTPTVTVLHLDPRDGAKAYGRLHVRFNQANCQSVGMVTAGS